MSMERSSKATKKMYLYGGESGAFDGLSSVERVYDALDQTCRRDHPRRCFAAQNSLYIAAIVKLAGIETPDQYADVIDHRQLAIRFDRLRIM